MKKILLLCCVCGIAAAFARVVRPEALPPSPWADTEVSTNLPFAGVPSAAELRDFRIALSFLATPSNNVQVALGCDGDADGVLSAAETDFMFGWNCGAWQLNKDTHWAAATTNEMKNLSWMLRIRNGWPRALDMTENDVAVVAVTNAPALAGLYSSAWNLVRVTVRGVDAADARLVVAADPWGFFFKIR